MATGQIVKLNDHRRPALADGLAQLAEDRDPNKLFAYAKMAMRAIDVHLERPRANSAEGKEAGAILAFVALGMMLGVAQEDVLALLHD